jgi:hypothetical protein
MNVKIRIPGDERLDLVAVPVASATVIAQGDLISYEGGLAVVLDAEAEDATFIGVAEQGSSVGETTPIAVWNKCIVDAPVTSAAYTIGASIGLNAGGTALEASADNTLFNSIEDTGGANATTLKCLVDVALLGKLFVNAS